MATPIRAYVLIHDLKLMYHLFSLRNIFIENQMFVISVLILIKFQR